MARHVWIVETREPGATEWIPRFVWWYPARRQVRAAVRDLRANNRCGRKFRVAKYVPEVN